MTEADILENLTSRSEIMWSLTQWLVSVSFAVMVAAYFGVEKLTRFTTSIIVSIYILFTVLISSSLTLHGSYIGAATEALQLLSETTQLSPIGINALRAQGSMAQFISPVFLLCSVLFTIGFVIYCYTRLRESK